MPESTRPMCASSGFPPAIRIPSAKSTLSENPEEKPLMKIETLENPSLKTCILAVALLALVLPAVAIAEVDAFVGAEKVQDELLDQMRMSFAKGERAKHFRVIVTLRPAESAAERHKAMVDKTAQSLLKANITRAQDSVLRAQYRGDVHVLRRYETLYGFSAVVDKAAIRDFASMDGVERLEVMPVHYKMDAEAHPITNVDDVHASGTTGSGVTIAIIDDGIDHDHAAFGGSAAWPNAKILGGFDFADNDSNPRIDCTAQSHGTAVAGVAAGDGGGVVGAAKDAKIVFLKIQSASICGQPSLDGDIIGAIDWAVANRNAFSPAIKIISMSLGGGLFSSSCDGSSAAYATAVNNAVNAGMTVLAASGNDGSGTQIARPACLTGAIAVGATYDANIGGANFGICNDTTTAADKVTCYSNSNAQVDILAPSHCASTAQAGGGQNTCFGGTSSATPYAAGVTALLYEEDPSVTPSAVRSTLSSTGVSITDTKNGLAKPRVDAQAAIAAVGGGGGGGTALTNGVTVSSLGATTGSGLAFTLEVPAGATNLVFQTSGGSGDADLYVRFGSAPTTATFDCRSWASGNSETCSFATPSAGTYHVLLHAYSTFSGASLTGSFTAPSGGGGAPCTGCEAYSGSLTGTGDADAHPNGTYYFSGSAGNHHGWLEGPGSADFDLELYRWTGSWTKVAESTSASSSEEISYNGASGYYYWRIVSFSGSGSYDFWLDRP